MSRVKVTRSYQVTLPKDVRDRVGIQVGDYLEVYIDEHGRIVMEKVKKVRKRLTSGRVLTQSEIEALIVKGLGEALA